MYVALFNAGFRWRRGLLAVLLAAVCQVCVAADPVAEDSAPAASAHSGVNDQSCTNFQGVNEAEAILHEQACGNNRVFTRTAILSAGAEFGFDSNELSGQGVAVLQRLIGDLSGFSQIQAIRVFGHTDSSGPAVYNLHLSQLRARYIGKQFRVAFPSVPVSTVGKGESEPIATNSTRTGRLKNRRVEIEVVAIK